MRVINFSDAEAFCRRVEPNLLEAEVENNLVLGLIASLRRGAAGRARMMTVEAAGEVRLAAVMTASYKLALSKADRPALVCLAEALWRRRAAPPGVNGLAEVSAAFARAWQDASGQEASLAMEMQLYTLEQVSLPREVSGALRAATRDDLALVVAWLHGFFDEAHIDQGSRDLTQELAARQIEQRRMFLWPLDGAPLSLAGCHDLSRRGARVGPVFTPPEQRGKGYASACVGRLSQDLLDGGKTWCGIFADLANPASNRIYQRLGYRAACGYREYLFAARP